MLSLESVVQWVPAIFAVVAAIAAARALRFNRDANTHARKAADEALFAALLVSENQPSLR